MAVVNPFLLIWSEEHGAWWKPGRMGYTRSIRAAGRYTLSEATEIVEAANRYLKDGFNEIVVFDPERDHRKGGDDAAWAGEIR